MNLPTLIRWILSTGLSTAPLAYAELPTLAPCPIQNGRGSLSPRPQMQHDFAIPRNGMAGRVVCVGHHRKGHDLRHRLLEGPCELPSQFRSLAG